MFPVLCNTSEPPIAHLGSGADSHVILSCIFQQVPKNIQSAIAKDKVLFSKIKEAFVFALDSLAKCSRLLFYFCFIQAVLGWSKVDSAR